MNLIEQLGGYEKAKAKFRDNGSLHAERLKAALLEYRRQHNIFEVGDIVIVNSHESVYQIQYVYESACGYGMYQGGRFSHSMIERHATDEEIKAGKRLGVNQ